MIYITGFVVASDYSPIFEGKSEDIKKGALVM